MTARDVQALGLTGVSPEELAGFTEVMQVLGVSRRMAQIYIARDDFPKPLGRIAAGPVWWRSEIEHWGKTHLPLPKGRPRKSEP